ncbi:MAG: tRNA pseudouridine(38-40) synthase TruA [Deltaproteobacteria bacterium]|nr:tRNA pseudouridine(38-40) synthase TruA [Deltaproteobacteria bacterium]
MRTLKLTLEYDGTGYVGWQVQPNGPSIQAELERSLSKLLQEPVKVTGAGRTDAGVHARGQVASLRTGKTLPLKAFVAGSNALLPKDIAVTEALERGEGFDARRSARGKIYLYRIVNRPTRAPLERRQAWEIFQPLDLESMARAAQMLLGRHDFSAFRASDCEARTTVREVRRLEVRRDGPLVELEIEATAFLKHMVRNIVGTLVEVGRGRRAEASVAEVLAGGDRTRAGATAPAHGLCLEKVFYEESPGLPSRLGPGDEP